MTVLDLLMNGDYKQRVPTVGSVVFTPNTYKVIRQKLWEKIRVWWDDPLDLVLWDEIWSQIEVEMRPELELCNVNEHVRPGMAAPVNRNAAFNVAHMRTLDRLFVIADPVGVAKFLQKHDSLAAHLLSAADVISFHFGVARSNLAPKWDSEHQTVKELVIRIPPSGTPQEAVKLLSDFRRNYWLDQPYEIRCLISIRYDIGG